VPDSFSLSGLEVLGSRDVILWSKDHPYLPHIDSASSETVPLALPPGFTPSGVRRTVDGNLEALDLLNGEIFRFGESRQVSHMVGPVELEVVSVAGTPHTWLLLVVESGQPASRSRIVTLKQSERGAYLDTLFALDGEFSSISSTESGLLLTRSAPPFGGLVFRDGEPGPVVLESAFSVVPREGFRMNDDWRAVTTVPIDSGFVQTLAQGTSDRRILVRWDNMGRPLSARILAVPMALRASDIARTLLWAVRRRNSTEIVKYRWSWIEG